MNYTSQLVRYYDNLPEIIHEYFPDATSDIQLIRNDDGSYMNIEAIRSQNYPVYENTLFFDNLGIPHAIFLRVELFFPTYYVRFEEIINIAPNEEIDGIIQYIELDKLINFAAAISAQYSILECTTSGPVYYTKKRPDEILLDKPRDIIIWFDRINSPILPYLESEDDPNSLEYTFAFDNGVSYRKFLPRIGNPLGPKSATF